MKRIVILLIAAIFILGFTGGDEVNNDPPIYIAFLWHMHQPIYWPYESIVETELNNRYNYSVFDIHNQRTGTYTSWPKDAVQKGIDAGFGNFGAQVSFSGSLIENLNNLEDYGNGNFQNWKNHWNYIKTQTTSLSNPRLDMIAFGYHHPLMGLIDYVDIRKQIQDHKQIFSQNFSGNYSKGIFPPENAFVPGMIPALVDEGIEWVLIDNIHFERASENYPFNTGGNLYEANKSDILNPDPGDWVQLNGVWAPTKISAQWGHQPHYVKYIDPETGEESQIIAVPADRYMGVEDGRGGFGALNYDEVMSQIESYNTDPDHPILIVLAHDGDNFGGGTESYYHSNFQNFVNWLQSNSDRFVCTTIQDYLEMFPPDQNDVIHVEDGSWSGADNGDPEFKKWNGDPGSDGYSPDRNSWGVITAAKNYVLTANQIDPNNSNTQNAWKYLLNGEASDYWYWDSAQNGIWDTHPTRASNPAINFAEQVISSGTDLTGPTIYTPQREPYNPGGTEWGINMPSDFKVWSYVFDVNGLQSVKLKYRTDNDGINSIETNHNETYTGGSDVGNWNELPMSGTYITPQTNILPEYKAKEFTAEVTGLNDVLVDYYIEATDNEGNISKSSIRHVWIGQFSGSGGSGVSWVPQAPTKNDSITIYVAGVTQGANLHWGVNNTGSDWQTPHEVYWPEGTFLFNGTGPAVETPFEGPANDTLKLTFGPFNKPEQNVERIAFVIHYDDDTWDNNNGQDYHIDFGGGGGNDFVMDGDVDENSMLAGVNNNTELYVGWNGTDLYVATESAQTQENDVFVFVSDSQRTMIEAPWAKSGTVSQWGAFLGNESSNNWSGWFDQTGSTQQTAGNYLEGTLNIEQEFGYTPNKLYIYTGVYETDDDGVLSNQVPAGNGDGNIDQGELYEFDYVITGVEEENNNPEHFVLMQNYPNPFNPTTNIEFSLPSPLQGEGPGVRSHVELIIYDVLGSEVATLVNENKKPGTYTIKFDAKDLSSGIYFYRLTVTGSSKNYSETKKMLLLR